MPARVVTGRFFDVVGARSTAARDEDVQRPGHEGYFSYRNCRPWPCLRAAREAAAAAADAAESDLLAAVRRRSARRGPSESHSRLDECDDDDDDHDGPSLVRCGVPSSLSPARAFIRQSHGRDIFRRHNITSAIPTVFLVLFVFLHCQSRRSLAADRSKTNSRHAVTSRSRSSGIDFDVSARPPPPPGKPCTVLVLRVIVFKRIY